jgi:hypothetical protein
MLSRYISMVLVVWMSTSYLSYGQINNCNPVDTVVTTDTYEGTAFFNYGSVSKARSQKYRLASAIGQVFVGYSDSDTASTNLGFYSRYLLPPLAMKVFATQGDLLDRIQITWEINALGPSPNEGFNIYRDGVFLATVGSNIRNYNDFNVIAGVAYEYTVRGLNFYGEGSPSYALGFQIPNGVVTGWINTTSGSPVADAVVTLMPMQGFSASLGYEDGASSIASNNEDFFVSDQDWTMTFYMKTDTAQAHAKLISYGNMNLYVRAIESNNGDEGIEIATSENGESILSSLFYDNIHDWNHIAISYESETETMRLYVNGVLMGNTFFDDTFNPSEEILKIGYNGNSGGWKGRLDELRIYHTLLSELDLPEIMHGTASSQTPNLAYYWKMDEELGDKSYDVMKRKKLFFCGAEFDQDRPPVRTAGKTNEDGFYTIESASYGTGTTFIAEPSKSFYLHKAVRFKRSENTSISIPNFALPRQSTIEVWVNNSAIPNTQTILSKKSNDNEFRLFISPSDDGPLLKILLNGETAIFGDLAPGYRLLSVTIDSVTNEVIVYNNGEEIGVHTFGGSLGDLSSNDHPWILGAHRDGNDLVDHFNGLIDEFAVYDTILTDIEIEAHFDTSRDLQDAGLYVYFPLDEGAGNGVTNVGPHFLDFGLISSGTWSSFAPNQVESPHKFTPKTRQVTLNPSVTSVDQVDFTDRSTIPVSGFIRFKDSDCFVPNVEILVNGASFNPRIFTDSIGKFVVDFNPGFTATLSAKYEDHAFTPLSYQVTRVSSPIAGIVFNDLTTRTVSGQIAGGLCRRSIMDVTDVVKVNLESVDGCFRKEVLVDDVDGFFEVDNLPALENMTVSVVHTNPIINTFFNNKGFPTVDLSQQDTNLLFTYFAEPQIEIVSGLELNACNKIVLDQNERKELHIKLKENYVGGTCDIDSAHFRIVNGFGDETIDTTMGNGLLVYKYVVGKPNPSPPFYKTLQVVSTTLEGNKGEFATQGVVTGIFEKLPTFTTQMPETPTMVLHDPPGDGSYSFIEKGQKVCEKMTISTEMANGGGIQNIFDFGPDQNIFTFFGAPNVELETVTGPDITILNTIRKLSSNSMELCKTFSHRISTSQNDLILGTHGGDVFMGGGLNINFGLADVILFDTMLCEPYDTLAVNIQPGQYGTEFIYTEWHIKNTVIPHLDTLRSKATDTVEYNRFNNSILRWQKILSDNNKRKERARAVKNISFSAGAEYEYTETIDTLQSTTTGQTQTTNYDQDHSIIVKVIGIGGGVVVKSRIEAMSSSTTDHNNEKGVTTGYVLADDDILDAYAVDICIDSMYKTPLFKIRAGQSSCPWEPGTAKREGVNLVCTNDGPNRTDVPANEPATFEFILGNTSSTSETFTYAFTAGPESNKHGAKIFCNGAPMNQIQWYAIPYGTSLPVTVTVERGSVEYDYDSLEIVLYSACEDQRANDLGILPDTAEFLYSAVYVSAHFIRPCSEVNIYAPEQDFVITPSSGSVKMITVNDYNIDPKFKLIRMQYRRVNGDGTWININNGDGSHERYNPHWQGFDNLMTSSDTLSKNRYDFFFWETAPFEDGEYEIRAVSECDGDDANGFSQIIKGKIDRQAPALLGVPQPSDGVYHVGDEISFTFNQAINCQKFIQLQDLGSLLRDAITNTVIEVTRSCVDNKIVLVPEFNNEEFENHVLKAELFNVRDLTGNINPYEKWEFYVDRNELAWLSDTITLTKYVDQTKTITAKIHNRGGYPVPYSITAPDWIRVTPDRGTLVANEIETISFTVDSLVQLGDYFDDIVLHTEIGANPFFMGGDETLTIHTRVLCHPEKWVINPDAFDGSAYEFSMNLTVALNIEGELSTDVEDLVGAYVANELRGVAKVKYYPSLGQHLAFLTVFSNDATGETIDFQIWDASDCKLYGSTLESFEFYADSIMGDPFDPEILHTNSNLLRKIYIHPGWNWISFNLGLVDPEINAALNTITDPADGFIKNQTAFSIYEPSFDMWLGDLDSIDFKPMYQYKSIASDSISMIGTYIDPETEIPLQAGWNWMGYLPHQGMSISNALASLSPQSGDIIKSQVTFSQYVDGLGWIGNLNFLSPPNGYLLKLATPDTLVYPDPLGLTDYQSGVWRSSTSLSPEQPLSVSTLQSMPVRHWQLNPSAFEYNMNAILIVSKENDLANLLDEGDEVGVFVDDQLRGSGVSLWIPSLNAYMIFATIYANKNGEHITFKYYDVSSQSEYSILESAKFASNSIMGKVTQPMVLHLSSTSGNSDFIDQKALICYPNPFHHSLYIVCKDANSKPIHISILDVLGHEVFSDDIDEFTEGLSYEWKPKSDVPYGPYLVKIKSGDQVYTQSVLYIK